jgi:hypothetical protein
MPLCLRCNKVETNKKVDGVPVCTDCYVKDAKENKGRAMDYSHLQEPAPLYVSDKPKKVKK